MNNFFMLLAIMKRLVFAIILIERFWCKKILDLTLAYRQRLFF